MYDFIHVDGHCSHGQLKMMIKKWIRLYILMMKLQVDFIIIKEQLDRK